MAKINKIERSKNLFEQISNLIEQVRKKVAITINEEMVILYWNIGKTIKNEIIKSERAEYGKQIVQSLTAQLTQRYGKGFSSQNLWYMVQLYEAYPILHALRGEFKNLSWTHVRALLPIKDKIKRQFYAVLCQKEHWSTRTFFYFVARQKRITVDNEDYYIDLLFYHRKLRCFVVIDLKLGKFKAKYKGQMELYLRYIEKYEMIEDENLPVGIILCAEKGKEQIELLFLPQDRIKVSEYITKLPPKKLLAEKLHKAIQIARVELGTTSEKYKK